MLADLPCPSGKKTDAKSNFIETNQVAAIPVIGGGVVTFSSTILDFGVSSPGPGDTAGAEAKDEAEVDMTFKG